MNSKCKLCRVINVVLLLVVLGLGYFVLKPSNVEVSADGRTLVLLTPGERDMVLGEMRGMLETVQAIVEGASGGELMATSLVATEAGIKGAVEANAALIGRVPVEFMALGMDTHRAFDALAETAQGTDDPLLVLSELSEIMNRCTACHASYRLGIEGAEKPE